MDKKEAVKEMEAGKKVTHKSFSPNEWMTIEDGKMLLEDGVKCSLFEFWRWRTGTGWDDGYSLYNDKT